jgi:hypothetical protein
VAARTVLVLQIVFDTMFIIRLSRSQNDALASSKFLKLVVVVVVPMWKSLDNAAFPDRHLPLTIDCRILQTSGVGTDTSPSRYLAYRAGHLVHRSVQ